MSGWPTLEDIRAAHARIGEHAHRTPVLGSRSLDELTGMTLSFKCENLQRIGAFKFRGALNSVLSLDEARAARGVATHSSGNHGAAIALAARMRGIPAHVIMPAGANAAKRRAVEAYGASVVECGPSLEDRDTALEALVGRLGAEVIHPYDDYRVITGQGTAAMELLEALPSLDAVVTPVGGGGLISGTAIAVKALSPGTRVIGCEPAGADDAWRSFKAGRIIHLEAPSTVADGLRAGIGRLTFPIISALVDDIVTVSETGIVDAMRVLWERTKLVVEPSAAVTLAGLVENELGLSGKRVGVVLSGGNVDLDRLPW